MLSIEVRPVAILGPLQVKIVIIIIKALRYKRIINSGKKVISKNKVMNKKTAIYRGKVKKNILWKNILYLFIFSVNFQNCIILLKVHRQWTEAKL